MDETRAGEAVRGAKRLDALLQRASQLQKAGRLVQARQVYEDILRHAPQQPDALHLLGVVSARLGEPGRAIDLIEQAIAHDPQNPVYHFNLANSYKACGAARRAVELYREALALKGDFAKAGLALGNLLLELGELEEAEATYRHALRIDPADPVVLARLSAVLERSHRLDEARSALEKGLAISPDDPILNLAAVKLARREGIFADAIQRLRRLDPAQLGVELRTEYHFELGQLHDRSGETEAAFEQFSRMNRALAQTPVFQARDQPPLRRQIRILRQMLTNAETASWARSGAGQSGQAPVFLVGFPRSGTTLIGQILDSHTEIQTLDEEPAVQAMVDTAAKLHGGYPECLPHLTPGEIAEIRAGYFQVVEAKLGGRPRRLLVDKVPLASVHLGLIHRVFPDARVVFAVRHPCDVCLSCFMQAVKSHDAPREFLTLEGIARLYAEVMSLWEAYDSVLPIETYKLRYEALVLDFGKETRELLGFIGVGWDDAVLHYWTHAQAHRGGSITPSYGQVTKPIYRTSAERWKGYSRHLGPIMDTLRPFMVRFGYEGG